jgi:hypothetical protein
MLKRRQERKIMGKEERGVEEEEEEVGRRCR